MPEKKQSTFEKIKNYPFEKKKLFLAVVGALMLYVGVKTVDLLNNKNNDKNLPQTEQDSIIKTKGRTIPDSDNLRKQFYSHQDSIDHKDCNHPLEYFGNNYDRGRQ